MFTIAIVGRPNVGKSSLFNALLGYRRTIVLDMPGTTMDSVSERVKWCVDPLHLIDSQGIHSEKDKPVLDSLLHRADAILFIVDGMVGITPFDRWIAEEVRLVHKPTLLCVNKTESKSAKASSVEFSELGFDETLDVSAVHRQGVGDMKSWCLRQAGQPEKEEADTATAEDFEDIDEDEALEDIDGFEAEEAREKDGPLLLALVGRPNTGKSTLMNLLCKEFVSRVSPIPHTTRDPVSFELETPEGVIRLVDTAGMRRPRSQKDQVEIFSIHASTRTIKRADVVFLLIASHEPISEQDMRLLNLLERAGKPAVVLLNFWDQLGRDTRKHYFSEIDFAEYLKQFRTLPISGMTGFNTDQLLPLAFRLMKQTQKRVKTSKLNDIVEKIITKNPPPASGRQNFNILYASQVKAKPPTFVFFLNRKGALPASYQKYLENQLREKLGLKGQPIRVYFRGSDKNSTREKAY